jgi:hypothetical protein
MFFIRTVLARKTLVLYNKKKKNFLFSNSKIKIYFLIEDFAPQFQNLKIHENFETMCGIIFSLVLETKLNSFFILSEWQLDLEKNFRFSSLFFFLIFATSKNFEI